MNRKPLPARRPSVSIETDWQGHPITVTASYYPDGTLGEVFADAPKGGHMQATLADACVLISIALQHGISVADLSKSLARTPDLLRGKGATTPASPVGSILEVLGAA
jgi:hypothetical protein